MSIRRLGALSLCICAASCVADASPDPAAESLAGASAVKPSILKGTVSDAAQDAVVMLVTVKPEPNIPLGICTATLIAPRLVLTARHCVAHANENVACLSNGTPEAGGEVTGNHDPKDLFVFTGNTRPVLDPATWTPAGAAAEIIDDGSGNLCNHDIALIVLKDPITNVPIAPIRLDGEVAVGESLLTVGWGVSSGEIEPTKRQQRNGVTVKRVGPNDGFPTITKNEFLFDESICLGDSGGPIFADQTKAVIAVVSRGSNGADPTKGGPAYTCDQADNLGTRVAPFKDMMLRGFERAGAQPVLEDKPSEDKCSACGVGSRSKPSSSLSFFVLIALTGLLRRSQRRR